MVLGNQAVGTYRSLARLGLAQHIFGEEVTSGLTVNSLPNTNLSWETTKTLNLAVDFNVLAGRVGYDWNIMIPIHSIFF